MNRITFCRATINRFEEELQKAYQRDDKNLISRDRIQSLLLFLRCIKN